MYIYFEVLYFVTLYKHVDEGSGISSTELQAAESEVRYFTKGTMRIVRFMCDERMGWKNWMVCKHLLVPSRTLIAHGVIRFPNSQKGRLEPLPPQGSANTTLEIQASTKA